MSGFTPINQVRLTNVAYVRLNKKGKRFEIACYRNKVLNWRNKIETDLNEVLQIDNIFTNVSKGMLASAKDLIDVFGTSDHKVVCKDILDKGELQVSEQERNALLDSMFRDIASIVVDKTLHPQTSRPYTISMIQNAMKQIHYSVNTSKSAKSQALEVIRKLKDVMPIVRANILLRIVAPQEYYQIILSSTINNNAIDRFVIKDSDKPSLTLPSEVTSTVDSTTASSSISSTSPSPLVSFTISVDPELYRSMEEHISTHSSGQGRVEIIQLRTGIFPAAMAEAAGSSSSSIDKKSYDSSVSTVDSKININGSDSILEADKDGNSNSNKEKKGKKAKRLEKELAKERDEVMNRIKGRLVIEKISTAATTLTDENNSSSSSSDIVSSCDDPSKIATAAETSFTSVTPAAEMAPAQKCNTCGGSFGDTSSFRAHFKSEWHRCNLSRKLKGLAMHSEEDFLALPYFDHLTNLT